MNLLDFSNYFPSEESCMNTLKHNVRNSVLFVKNATTQPTFGKKTRLLFNVKNADIGQLFAAEPL